MKVIYNNTMSINECIILASKHIKQCVSKNATGIKDIKNNAQLKNRIAEYAVLIFVNRNHYKTFTIDTLESSLHYGKAIGTEIKTGMGLGEVSPSLLAIYYKQVRKLLQACSIELSTILPVQQQPKHDYDFYRFTRLVVDLIIRPFNLSIPYDMEIEIIEKFYNAFKATEMQDIDTYTATHIFIESNNDLIQALHDAS